MPGLFFYAQLGDIADGCEFPESGAKMVKP
jgi:hypothetical protein